MTLTQETAQRYSRHFTLKEIGVSGQKKLFSSKVLIIGAGGLGSSAALYLAAAGVGNIGICDGDKVELSNLQRQIIHSVDEMGNYKVDSASKAIKARNPDIEICTYPTFVNENNIIGLIEGYDFVVDCTDRFETKFLINDACVIAKKPYSHAGVVGFGGQAMTYVPGAPCLRCLLGGVPKNAPTCAEMGVLGAVVGMMGCLQATETIKYLLGRGELLTGKVLKVDALNMKFTLAEFGSPDPDCAVCGSYPTITDLRKSASDYKIVCG